MHALAATLAAVLSLGRAALSADLAPPGTRGLIEPSEAAPDPCDGGGWVGDGRDGRAPPACDGPDGDEADAAGLHEPDRLRSDDEDGEDGAAAP